MTRIKAMTLARYGILATAITLIVVGLARNEQQEVLHKAVKICLECIGIG
jgi:hypothetical protein